MTKNAQALPATVLRMACARVLTAPSVPVHQRFRQRSALWAAAL